jgi:Tetracyclin repressor-like, C-terminal domain
VLLPRRATGLELIERGQARGDIKPDIDPVAALDLFAGPFLARVFAGVDTGTTWRETAFEAWWNLVKHERHDR